MFDFNKSVRVESLELPHHGEQFNPMMDVYIAKLIEKSQTWENAPDNLKAWVLKGFKTEIEKAYNKGYMEYLFDLVTDFDETTLGTCPEGDDFIESIKFINQDLEHLDRKIVLITFKKTLEEVENENNKKSIKEKGSVIKIKN